MALVFIDGFDHYQTSQIVDKGFSQGNIHTSFGRRGGGALFIGNGGDWSKVFPVTVTDPLLVVGFAYYQTNFNTFRMMGISDDAGNTLSIADVNGVGAVTLKNNVSGTVVSTVDGFVTLDVYAYYELVHYQHDSVGYVQLWKDGVKILEILNEDTTNGNNFRTVNGEAGLGQYYYDDMYVLDGSGSTNNSRLGDVRVDTIYPDSDGTTSDFIPFIAGDNYAMMDETLTDEDGTFIEAGTISAEEYSSFPTPSLGTVIYGVQHSVHHRKTDAGTVDMNLKTFKPGGTGKKIHTVDTSNDDYTFTSAVFDTDPDDSGTWSDSRVGATEFGFSIVDITT